MDGARQGVLASLNSGVGRWIARWEFPDPWFGWRRYALAAVRGRRFDAVLATIPPYTPALVAREAAARSGAKLILDYRDPWTEAPRADWGSLWNEDLRERHRKLEDACLASADLALAVTPTIRRWLTARTSTRVLLFPNSYEPRAAPAPPMGAPFRIVYAGSLAYGRDLDPLLAAMASLGPEAAPDRLVLEYAGSQGSQVMEKARARGIAGSVRDRGNLSASEARALLTGAMAGVVLVAGAYEYSVPGKIFDILAMGAPVLMIGPSGSDAAGLVREHGLGWCHEPDDVAGLAVSLGSALRGNLPHPDRLEELQTGPLMARLDHSLRELVGR